MANSADPDQCQVIWIYTVCKGRVYPGSAGQGLSIKLNISSHFKISFLFFWKKPPKKTTELDWSCESSLYLKNKENTTNLSSCNYYNKHNKG